MGNCCRSCASSHWEGDDSDELRSAVRLTNVPLGKKGSMDVVYSMQQIEHMMHHWRQTPTSGDHALHQLVGHLSSYTFLATDAVIMISHFNNMGNLRAGDHTERQLLKWVRKHEAQEIELLEGEGDVRHDNKPSKKRFIPHDEFVGTRLFTYDGRAAHDGDGPLPSTVAFVPLSQGYENAFFAAFKQVCKTMLDDDPQFADVLRCDLFFSHRRKQKKLSWTKDFEGKTVAIILCIAGNEIDELAPLKSRVSEMIDKVLQATSMSASSHTLQGQLNWQYHEPQTPSFDPEVKKLVRSQFPALQRRMKATMKRRHHKHNVSLERHVDRGGSHLESRPKKHVVTHHHPKKGGKIKFGAVRDEVHSNASSSTAPPVSVHSSIEAAPACADDSPSAANSVQAVAEAAPAHPDGRV